VRFTDEGELAGEERKKPLSPLVLVTAKIRRAEKNALRRLVPPMVSLANRRGEAALGDRNADLGRADRRESSPRRRRRLATRL